jgi:hypothetical protein
VLGLADTLRARSGVTHAVARRELVIWVVAVLFASRLFRIETEPLNGLLDGLATLLAQNSVFHYIGWYAVFSLLRESTLADRARPWEVACALGLCVVNVLQAKSTVWVSATAVSLYLWVMHPGNARIRAAAAVLLALAVNGLWAPLIFRTFSYPILVADAVMVGGALSLLQEGTTWLGTNIVGTRSGHRVLIYGPCSSFHNISLGFLCWVSLTMLARPRWVRDDLSVASMVAMTIILLNTARLCLIALSPDAASYNYWHGGPGEEFLAWAMTGCVLAISLWGALRVGRAP